MDLNPRFRFDAFIVGPTNRLAATAAQAVAATPGATYNPLFIYARSGLGKTHLLQAVGHAAQEAQPGLRVLYLTLEEFVEQYHAAVAAGQSDGFRRSAAETAVLLVDDVQFLAKHREMQAELLRLAEAQQGAGGQLVLTSDRPPAEIQDLDERLISRLSGGLLVDMAPPDFETRLAILRRKAEERGTVFGPGVLDVVAEAGASNVRELLGQVNRLIAFQAVGEAPLTPAGARALMAGEADPSSVGSAAAAPAPAPGSVPASAPGPPEADEFSAFLSAVTRTVAQSLDAWRSRVGEAVVRWQGEGYRTTRLESLLQQTSLPDVEAHLARFAADVETLRQLAEQAGAIDAYAAGHARFRDPDRLEEARNWVAQLVEGATPPPGPTAALTFADYVIGAANEAVVRAAKLVADAPGLRYNPLFLSGPSGVGKSHLLHAVGNTIAAAGRSVACLPAPAFVEDLLAALASDTVDRWRRRYRGADALLLDDVQLLAGKDQSQDELFNIFNTMVDAEKQLVFTADRAPSELGGIAARLVTRFEGGLLVELAPPDRSMREVMVRQLLVQHDVKGAADVVEYLAARPADSARAVQGLVNRALSAMQAGEDALSLEAARFAIEGRQARPSQAYAVSSVIPAGLDATLSSREKVVWDWPDIGARLIEDLR